MEDRVEIEQHFRERNGFNKAKSPPLHQMVLSGIKTYDYRNKAKMLFGAFPMSLKGYNLQRAVSDGISGATVALVRIPQGMAYALLAGVSVQYGLYTELFSCILYSVLATSRQNSVGSTATMEILVGEVVENKFDSENGSSIVPLDDPERIRFVKSFTALVGILQISFGLLQVHRLAKFLPKTVVSSFTTGLAFHIGTSQLRNAFGLSKTLVPRTNAIGGLFITWYRILKNLPKAQVASVVISVITIAVCYPAKLLSIKFKKQLRSFPIPGELIILIGMIIFCTFWSGADIIDKVGAIPSGLAAPTSVDVTFWKEQIASAIPIAILGYAIILSLTKTFAYKNAYAIDPMTEAFALGLANSVGAVFNTIPATTSLSRTSLQDSAGGKTQIASIVSSLVVLVTLLALGEYLSVMPKAALSCIVIVNLRGMFRQFLLLPDIWKYSKLDGTVWFVTMFVTVAFGMLIGLGVGVGLKILITILRSKSKSNMLVKISGIYREQKYFPVSSDKPKSLIYRFTDSLTYLSTEEMLNSLPDIGKIVLDFGNVSFVDYGGVCLLKIKLARYQEVAIANASNDVFESLCRMEITEMENVKVYPDLKSAQCAISDRISDHSETHE